MEKNEVKPVKVYYCKCGKSIQCAGDPDHFDHSTKLEFKQAEKWGRKVEIITLEQFHKIPFMCNTDRCPDKDPRPINERFNDIANGRD